MTDDGGRRRCRRAGGDGRRRDDASRGQRVAPRPHDRSRTTLGLIPAGTGNDLCRGIGLDPADSVAAAAVIAAGYTRSIDLAQVATALRRRRAGHRLRRPGQPARERDDLAARFVALHDRRARRAPGVRAAALPADPRRRGARTGGDDRCGREHRLVRRRHADLPERRPVRRAARRDDHPPGGSGQTAAAAAA